MTANELADWLDKKAIVSFTLDFGEHLELAADLLRQQQAEIEQLKALVISLSPNSNLIYTRSD
jgi:glutaredoxin 2